MNRLYFGDNLKWLRDKRCQSGSDFPDASVDLVHLDPPFNSNADYNDRNGDQFPWIYPVGQITKKGRRT